MNLDTGAPTDQLTDAAVEHCKKYGSNITTVSEFLEKKDEKLTQAIQEGIDQYNEHAISHAQKASAHMRHRYRNNSTGHRVNHENHFNRIKNIL